MANPSIELSSSSALPGNSTSVNLHFTAGDTGVASLQFDLVFNNSALSVTGVVGAAATAASKDLYSVTLAPGTQRWMLYGLNTDTLSSGTVVTFTVTVAPGTTPGIYSLAVFNVLASDATGGAVTITDVDGAVEALAPPPVTVTLHPAAGSVVLTHGTPRLITRLHPAAASITVRGGLPSLVGGPFDTITLHPAAGSVVVTGGTARLHLKLAPAAGSITLTGATPSLNTYVRTLLSPAAASVVLTGATPALIMRMRPAAGSITVRGGLPTLVGAAPETVILSPAAASVLLTGGTAALRLTLAPLPGSIVVSGGSGATRTVLHPAPGHIILQPGAPGLILPTAACLWLDLSVWRQLSRFATLRTNVDFAPGYEKAIRYALAVSLASEFNVQAPATVIAVAQTSAAKLVALNSSNTAATEDPAN